MFCSLDAAIKNHINIAGKAGNFQVLTMVKISSLVACDRLIEKLF